MQTCYLKEQRREKLFFVWRKYKLIEKHYQHYVNKPKRFKAFVTQNIHKLFHNAQKSKGNILYKLLSKVQLKKQYQVL